MSDLPGVPSYDELPTGEGLPARSAWGVFGADDQVGTLNFQSADSVRMAAGLIRTGQVFPLSWDLELPDPPLFGRRRLRHRVITLDPVGTEDAYDDFYPQGSSQWDALAHIAHPDHGFYNGVTYADITGRAGSRNGIEHWARRGIVGRYVLADLARWREAQGRPINPEVTEPVSIDEVEQCLDEHGLRVEPGDVLLLRFGWVAWYSTTDRTTRESLASTDFFSAPGLVNEVRTASWLWDHQVAAVAADNPALEVMPFNEADEDGYLHYRLIPLLGLAVGELFFLDDLAETCAKDGVYEGLFTAAPLNKVGGSGSPANALALR